jgi:hypothetical protein
VSPAIGLSCPGPTAPSAAVALGHVRPSRVDAAVLGDCSVALGPVDGHASEVIRDDRLQRVAGDLRVAGRLRRRLARLTGLAMVVRIVAGFLVSPLLAR